MVQEGIDSMPFESIEFRCSAVQCKAVQYMGVDQFNVAETMTSVQNFILRQDVVQTQKEENISPEVL